jgi:hypothetical protein
MKVQFRQSFKKDLSKIKAEKVLQGIEVAIDAVKETNDLLPSRCKIT